MPLRARQLALPALLATAVTLTACGNSAPVAARPAPVHSQSVAAARRTEPLGAPVNTYHRDLSRSGNTPDVPRPGRLTLAFDRRVSGAVYAQPLVVDGIVVVATEHNFLYGIDPYSGRIRWRSHQLGRPVPQSDLPCGDINPEGITSTPVYDPTTHQVFAVGEVLGGAGVHHVLVAVNPRTGRIDHRWSADPPRQNPTPEQERGALLDDAGRIYIPFGGLAGDCSQYHGYVVSYPVRGGRRLVYRTPSAREAGIWAPPGPVADSHDHLFVAVGNGAATGGRWDLSDSVLELSRNLHRIGAYAPTTWPTDNASDLDLGSSSPTLVPRGLVFADGKRGTAYTLRAGHLTGVGHQLHERATCPAYGGTAHRGDVIVVPCDDGDREVALTGSGLIRLGWRAPANVTGSPVLGGGAVFALDPAGGYLYVLSFRTGHVLRRIAVGAASRFATPAVSGHRVFVGTLDSVVCVTGA